MYTTQIRPLTTMTIQYCSNYKSHIIVVLKQTALWYTKGETKHRNDTLTPKWQGIHQNGTQTALIILTMMSNLSIHVWQANVDKNQYFLIFENEFQIFEIHFLIFENHFLIFEIHFLIFKIHFLILKIRTIFKY